MGAVKAFHVAVSVLHRPAGDLHRLDLVLLTPSEKMLARELRAVALPDLLRRAALLDQRCSRKPDIPFVGLYGGGADCPAGAGTGVSHSSRQL